MKNANVPTPRGGLERRKTRRRLCRELVARVFSSNCSATGQVSNMKSVSRDVSTPGPCSNRDPGKVGRRSSDGTREHGGKKGSLENKPGCWHHGQGLTCLLTVAPVGGLGEGREGGRFLGRNSFLKPGVLGLGVDGPGQSGFWDRTGGEGAQRLKIGGDREGLCGNWVLEAWWLLLWAAHRLGWSTLGSECSASLDGTKTTGRAEGDRARINTAPAIAANGADRMDGMAWSVLQTRSSSARDSEIAFCLIGADSSSETESWNNRHTNTEKCEIWNTYGLYVMGNKLRFGASLESTGQTHPQTPSDKGGAFASNAFRQGVVVVVAVGGGDLVILQTCSVRKYMRCAMYLSGHG
ncbi:hypothetical protein B0H66DRAFT_612170 [Apodospora peruviana]|uniref:Uncharacterized protein n=1 Tax=Apodospora peruviana TaxID=516989 RepID=A0AAE0IST6_9PEZI|nr:hypothetical protein B0H66DRAFT_612170 [Apodospora peruviana]